MSWVTEILQLLDKFTFFKIVNEYEQGLHYRAGRCIPRPIRWDKDTLDVIVQDEKEANRYLTWYDAVFKKQIDIPPGYYRSIATGFLKSDKRQEKSKILKAGFYLMVPLVDRIETDNMQERVLNLRFISVPTTDQDSKEVSISCNVRFRIRDYYKTFNAVHDYETSLKDYTLAMLAEKSRGHTYEEWVKAEFVEQLEEEIKEHMRDTVTNKWGLEILNIYITDNVASKMTRVMYEGPNLVNDDLVKKLVG